MSYNYPLKYRTFDQMLSEVAVDFEKYTIENLINPHDTIKVAKRVNYDLGLRIMKTKEAILEIEKGIVKLPADFYVLNYALICEEYELHQPTPQGTNIQEVKLYSPYQETPAQINTCEPPVVCQTTVQGCGCGCTPCECTPSEQTCNSVSNTTTTTTTTTIPGVSVVGHNCYWVYRIGEMPVILSYEVEIDGVMYTASTIEGLNALGLGTFTTRTLSFYERLVTVTGFHVYGKLIVHFQGYDRSAVINCGELESQSVDTKICRWIIPQKHNEAEIKRYRIYYNNTYAEITTSNGVNQADLSALGIGTFTFSVSNFGGGGIQPFVIITCIGTQDYGDIVELQNNPQTFTVTCLLVPRTTPEIITTVVTSTTNNDRVCYPVPDPCAKPRVFMNCKDELWEVVQIVNPATVYTYKRLLPLRLLQNNQAIECGCPNLYMSTFNTGYIDNGFLKVNFDCGRVYINYQGTLEDDDGNLLVPDHDGLNEYYEYATKERILENLMMNDEPVGQKLQYVQGKLRSARLQALNVVNTPNFAEMKALWMANRRAQYARFYNMFKSYTWYRWDRNPNLDTIVNPNT